MQKTCTENRNNLYSNIKMSTTTCTKPPQQSLQYMLTVDIGLSSVYTYKRIIIMKRIYLLVNYIFLQIFSSLAHGCNREADEKIVLTKNTENTV